MRAVPMLVTVAGTLALLSSCGGSSKTSSSAANSSPSAGATSTTSSAPSAASSYAGGASGGSGTQAVVVGVKHGKLGTILAAGPKRLTVYMFESDSTARSTCTGACARTWPPVGAGAVSTAAGVPASAFGSLTRADGTRQLTYAGHPLYYYASDKDRGDSYGEGLKSFGASWYALRPNGQKVDNS